MHGLPHSQPQHQHQPQPAFIPATPAAALQLHHRRQQSAQQYPAQRPVVPAQLVNPNLNSQYNHHHRHSQQQQQKRHKEPQQYEPHAYPIYSFPLPLARPNMSTFRDLPGAAFRMDTQLEVTTVLANCGGNVGLASRAIKLWIESKQKKGRAEADIIAKVEGMERKYTFDASLHEAFHAARAETGLPRSKVLPPSRRVLAAEERERQASQSQSSGSPTTPTGPVAQIHPPPSPIVHTYLSASPTQLSSPQSFVHTPSLTNGSSAPSSSGSPVIRPSPSAAYTPYSAYAPQQVQVQAEKPGESFRPYSALQQQPLDPQWSASAAHPWSQQQQQQQQRPNTSRSPYGQQTWPVPAAPHTQYGPPAQAYPGQAPPGGPRVSPTSNLPYLRSPSPTPSTTTISTFTTRSRGRRWSQGSFETITDASINDGRSAISGGSESGSGGLASASASMLSFSTGSESFSSGSTEDDEDGEEGEDAEDAESVYSRRLPSGTGTGSAQQVTASPRGLGLAAGFPMSRTTAHSPRLRGDPGPSPTLTAVTHASAVSGLSAASRVSRGYPLTRTGASGPGRVRTGWEEGATAGSSSPGGRGASRGAPGARGRGGTGRGSSKGEDAGSGSGSGSGSGGESSGNTEESLRDWRAAVDLIEHFPTTPTTGGTNTPSPAETVRALTLTPRSTTSTAPPMPLLPSSQQAPVRTRSLRQKPAPERNSDPPPHPLPARPDSPLINFTLPPAALDADAPSSLQNLRGGVTPLSVLGAGMRQGSLSNSSAAQTSPSAQYGPHGSVGHSFGPRPRPASGQKQFPSPLSASGSPLSSSNAIRPVLLRQQSAGPALPTIGPGKSIHAEQARFSAPPPEAGQGHSRDLSFGSALTATSHHTSASTSSGSDWSQPSAGWCPTCPPTAKNGAQRERPGLGRQYSADSAGRGPPRSPVDPRLMEALGI